MNRICTLKIIKLGLVVSLSLLFGWSSITQAQSVPESIPYEGFLSSNGQPVNQNIWMEFRIYDAADSSGSLRFRQRNEVTVSQGRFTQLIGPNGAGGNQLKNAIIEYAQLYLEVVILGDLDSTADDIVLLNRQRLSTVPYSVLSARSLNGNPVGTVQAFAGTNLPTGWLWCDGQAYNRQVYPELAEVLGVDSERFTVPDLRGYFIRGLDQTGTVDSEAGRQLRSVQADNISAHDHSVTLYVTFGGGGFGTGPGPLYSRTASGPSSPLMTTETAVTNTNLETRPKNVAFHYIIKH